MLCRAQLLCPHAAHGPRPSLWGPGTKARPRRRLVADNLAAHAHGTCPLTQKCGAIVALALLATAGTGWYPGMPVGQVPLWAAAAEVYGAYAHLSLKLIILIRSDRPDQ